MRAYTPDSRWPSRPYPRILPPMFVTFFQELKAAGLPVTLREFLTLMQAMERDLADRRVDTFYYLSRAALVKDERNLVGRSADLPHAKEPKVSAGDHEYNEHGDRG